MLYRAIECDSRGGRLRRAVGARRGANGVNTNQRHINGVVSNKQQNIILWVLEG